MNQRELSEKLEKLADKMEEVAGDWDKTMDLAEEVRKLSNENYAPGNSTTWEAIKPKTVKKQGGFIQSGKKTPF